MTRCGGGLVVNDMTVSLEKQMDGEEWRGVERVRRERVERMERMRD
jgi:hypothetical protein